MLQPVRLRRLQGEGMTDQEIEKAMSIIGLTLIGLITLGVVAIVGGIVAAVIA
jgi:hypothetical protein